MTTTLKRKADKLGEGEPGRTVNAGVKFDGVTYMPNHTADLRWAQCADMFDVEPRDLEEIVPQWEAIFEEIGGYWQLDGLEEEQPTAEQGLHLPVKQKEKEGSNKEKEGSSKEKEGSNKEKEGSNKKNTIGELRDEKSMAALRTI